MLQIIIDPSLPELICDVCLNGLLEADLLRDMCIKSHEVCLKSMSNDDNKSEDEAYVTETYDSDPDIIKDVSEVILTGARCCICAENFESIDLLRNHCLLKHSIELYENPKGAQCMVCGIQYETLEQLTNHISIFNPIHESVPAEKPSLEIRTPKYKRNKRTFRGKYKPGLAYKCHICKRNIRGYESHLKTEHPNDPIEFKCHVCPRSYSVMNSLISHMHNVHCDAHKFRCDICDKVFARNALMLQHRETTHFNVRKFECDFCHLKFARKQHLSVHAKTHLKHKVLKCKVCNIEFTGQPELDEHLFQHVYGSDS